MRHALVNTVEGTLVHTSVSPEHRRIFAPSPQPVYVPVPEDELTSDQHEIAKLMRSNSSRNFA